MKTRISILFFVSAGILAMSLLFQQKSQAALVVSDAQMDAIRTQCVTNQAGLNQLHQTDAFLRIDRGNLYRTISDKLMQPLNRRLAASELDNSEFLATTTQFNTEYKLFYAAYIKYDIALSKLLDTDCTKEPVTFYNSLITARNARTDLSETNQNLVRFIRLYHTQFKDFQSQYNQENQL